MCKCVECACARARTRTHTHTHTHLPRNCHNEGHYTAFVVQFVEAHDFTLLIVHTPLGQHAHPSLGHCGLEEVQEQTVRRLGDDLKVAEVSVTLQQCERGDRVGGAVPV